MRPQGRHPQIQATSPPPPGQIWLNPSQVRVSFQPGCSQDVAKFQPPGGQDSAGQESRGCRLPRLQCPWNWSAPGLTWESEANSAANGSPKRVSAWLKLLRGAIRLACSGCNAQRWLVKVEIATGFSTGQFKTGASEEEVLDSEAFRGRLKGFVLERAS